MGVTLRTTATAEPPSHQKLFISTMREVLRYVDPPHLDHLIAEDVREMK